MASLTQEIEMKAVDILQVSLLHDLTQREKNPAKPCDLYDQIVKVLLPYFTIENEVAKHRAKELQIPFCTDLKLKIILRRNIEKKKQQHHQQLTSSIIHCLTLLVDTNATKVSFHQAVIVKRIIEIVQFSRNLPEDMTTNELIRLAENNHNEWLKKHRDDDEDYNGGRSLDELESEDDEDFESLKDAIAQTFLTLIGQGPQIAVQSNGSSERSIHTQTETDLVPHTSAEAELVKDNLALELKLMKSQLECQELKDKLSALEQQEKTSTASSDTGDNISVNTNDKQGEEDESGSEDGVVKPAEEEQTVQELQAHDYGGGDVEFEMGNQDDGSWSEEDEDSVSNHDADDGEGEHEGAGQVRPPQNNQDEDVSVSSEEDDADLVWSTTDQVPNELRVSYEDDEVEVWEVECNVKGKDDGARTVAALRGGRFRSTCPLRKHGCKGKKSHSDWEEKIRLKTKKAVEKAWRKRMKLFDDDGRVK